MSTSLNKITPEEKLLHIIEHSGKKPGNIFQTSQDNTTTEKKKRFSLPNLSAFTDKIDLKKIKLKHINIVLIAFALLATVLISFYLIKENEDIRGRLADVKNNVDTLNPLNLEITKNNVPDYDGYIASISKKNPFRTISPELTNVPQTKEETITLKLVGILWSDRSQAIIEDETNQKTYMVYEGDTINQYTVVQINQNEVTLESPDGNAILK